MANILGINDLGHDAAACIIKDGKIIAAVEEERFTRRKHTGVFPKRAIQYCLRASGLRFSDIDHIGYYVDPKKIISKEGLRNLWNPVVLTRFLYLCKCAALKFKISAVYKKHAGSKRPKLHFVDHHIAHAASAYYPSHFSAAAILTLDGIGEWATGIFAYGNGNKIDVIKEVYFPHSLGYLYGAVTRYLGFVVNNDEYKVMGLASYGSCSEYYELFKDVVRLKEDGTYELNESYFDFKLTWGHVSRKFIDRFGPARKRSEIITKRHRNIAWALQKITEDTGIHMANWLYAKTKSKNLCLAGGVALNCVMNGKILEQTPFEDVYIQPASYDAGTSLGTALYIHNAILGGSRDFVLEETGLGPEFSDDEVESEIKAKNLKYRKCDNTAKETAQLIAKGLIVGWFNGRSEFGPRALGHRSILADPTRHDMQDIVNTRVKHREEFRPFAPSVLREKCSEYFENTVESPFMLIVCQVKQGKKHILPAITHVDGTARINTVKKAHNPKYWQLLSEFEKIKGVPVLLNTSFNVNGEPIVNTPREAINCFLSTGIDVLSINNFIIEK